MDRQQAQEQLERVIIEANGLFFSYPCGFGSKSEYDRQVLTELLEREDDLRLYLKHTENAGEAMGDVVVTLKNGKEYCGPLWAWRPVEGYLRLTLNPNHYEDEIPDKIHLVDVQKAIHHNVRYNVQGETRDEDLLEKARIEGWTPNEDVST